MLRRSAVLLLATAFLIPALVAAYISPGEPTGYVSDFAGILKAEDRASMEAKLESFEASTGNEIAVVTVTSLGGDTIENYAVELFEEWGIGKEREDNGVLMLVALEEREMRIEVGYGLEGALTDAQSYWIINNELKPAFQRGDYAAGINAGVDKVIAATQGEIIAEDSPEPQAFNFNFLIFGFVAFQWLLAILARSKSWWAGGVFGALGGWFLAGWLGFGGLVGAGILGAIGLLLDYAVSSAYRHGKGRGHVPWYAGGGGFHGGGGGFGGFGGGSSGGGGASGRW